MRKVFLDCGAHRGKMLDYFHAHWPEAAEYVVYAFEPNPAIGSYNDKCDELIKAAVWVEDGTMPLYRSKKKCFSSSSSLFSKKTTGHLDKKNPVSVPTIDFSAWLKKNVRVEDHVVAKMNIEGAEYAVLTELMNDETIGLIDVLYVKWHARKIGSMQGVHNAVVKRLRTVSAVSGITVYSCNINRKVKLPL